VSLANTAYTDLKRRILSLELEPGQFVTEPALCDLLELGRMPVHQAVHRLMSEGFVQILPRKGMIIRPDSLHDVLELLEARSIIEPQIAALAAKRISAEQLVAVRALIVRSSGLVDERHRSEFLIADRAFHQAIAEAAGNSVLIDAQRPLHERTARRHLRVWEPDALSVTQREHEAICRAIGRRDPVAAAKTMLAHVQSLRKRIVGRPDAGARSMLVPESVDSRHGMLGSKVSL
jgi:DNA-binding GntR family transcriptional regulator